MEAVADSTAEQPVTAPEVDPWTSETDRQPAQADASATTEATVVEPTQAERDERGQFKPKKEGNPRHDLNARLGQKAEEARKEKERADRLEQELQALRNQAPARVEAPKTETPKAAEKFPAFDAWIEQHPDATYDDYIDARAEAKAQAVLTSREREAAERREAESFQQAQSAFRRRNADAAAQRPDWGQTVSGLAQRFQAAGYQEFPPALDRAIVTSEKSADILYYLGTHPDVALQLAQDVATTGPEAASIVRRYLEAQITAPAAAADSAPRVRPSAAHAPINRVGGTANATPVDPDDLDFGPEYIRAENLRERKAREAGRW